MEIAALYFESLMNFKLKAIMEENRPKCMNRSSNINMKDRTCFHKVARCFYKVLRAIYVSVIFYYVPFMVIFGQWLLGWGSKEEGAEGEVTESGGGGEGAGAAEGAGENAPETSKMLA